MKNNGIMTAAFILVGLLALIAGGAGIGLTYLAGDFDRYFADYKYFVIAIAGISVFAFIIACCFAGGISSSNRRKYAALIEKVRVAEATAARAAATAAPIQPAAMTQQPETVQPAMAAAFAPPAQPAAATVQTAPAPTQTFAPPAPPAAETVQTAPTPVAQAFAPQAPQPANTAQPTQALRFVPPAPPAAETAKPAMVQEGQPPVQPAPAFASPAAETAKPAMVQEGQPLIQPAPPASPQPQPATIFVESPANPQMARALDSIRVDATVLKQLIENGETVVIKADVNGNGSPNEEWNEAALIDAIEDIAFRSHLMSLNLAIETSNIGDPDGVFISISEEAKNIENKTAYIAAKCKATPKDDSDYKLEKQAIEIINRIISVASGALPKAPEARIADPAPLDQNAVSPIAPNDSSGLYG